MSETRRYAIALVREATEYWAFVPDVPGVYGRGTTSDEAMADATDALEDYLAWLRENGELAPEPASDAVEVRYADVPA